MSVGRTGYTAFANGLLLPCPGFMFRYEDNLEKKTDPGQQMLNMKARQHQASVGFRMRKAPNVLPSFATATQLPIALPPVLAS